MAMVGDLLYHEYEVILGFFIRGTALVAAENAAVSLKLDGIASPGNDYVEHLYHHPNGPVELEQIVCRTTINELNALIEIALQEALEKASGSFFIESNGEFVIGPNRGVLCKELSKNGIDVNAFPNFDKLLQIKELSEGFKHRQRLRPLPRIKKGKWETPDTLLPGTEGQYMEQYEISLGHVSEYLTFVREFLERCRKQSLI